MVEWKNKPDLSTPLDADHLNQYSVDLTAIADAADASATAAAASAALAVAPTDAAMAAAVGNPASATRVSLGSTYGPRSLLRESKAGSRGFAFCGDSNTANGVTNAGTVILAPTPFLIATSWVAWAVGTGAGRWHLAAHAALGGITPATWRSTMLPGVIAAAPFAAVEMLGTNDVANLATQITELTAIYDAFDAAGIRVIVCSIPPMTSAIADVVRLNTWKQATARARGYLFVDNYAALVDYTTGFYLAAYDSGDGTHFNTAGAKAVGVAFNAAINAAYSDVSMLAKAQPAPALLLDKPLMLAKTGLVPEGWVSLGYGNGGLSEDVVAGIVGKAHTMSQAVDSGNTVSTAATFLANLIPGHRYRMDYKYVLTVVGTVPTSAYVRLEIATGGGDLLHSLDLSGAGGVPLSTVSYEFVCPTMSAYNYRIHAVITGGGVGTKMQIGQCTVIDLTLAGLA